MIAALVCVYNDSEKIYTRKSITNKIKSFMGEKTRKIYRFKCKISHRLASLQLHIHM